jgi:hypothetical protein
MSPLYHTNVAGCVQRLMLFSFNTITATTTRQVTDDGHAVTTYAHESSVPTIEDYCEAQTTDGSASIALDRTFASAINRKSGYMVFVTPEGDCRGLYVTQRTPVEFQVRELQGGRSSVAFSYRIVAKPLGATGLRLAAAVDPSYTCTCYRVGLTEPDLGVREVWRRGGRSGDPKAALCVVAD